MATSNGRSLSHQRKMEPCHSNEDMAMEDGWRSRRAGGNPGEAPETQNPAAKYNKICLGPDQKRRHEMIPP
eukprot:CAMPEP_0201971342 /NCGR_PEP_ID=MMETSP0904-20121228/36555_1 /ASSEMBLY_ACC=CAM_ASM_000553 /TAXON_ID=420261 /ORGANISM="Thalassiosira antarctica, Strain CCMP982" /LENGTH=70 /DNA_ID=CAMNT_0048520721 /DNA_START=29 /DNA_END=238 /DNA_ORIENTATION=-